MWYNNSIEVINVECIPISDDSSVLIQKPQYRAPRSAGVTLDIVVFDFCIDMFKIAGPVIVVGVALSMFVGLIYWWLVCLRWGERKFLTIAIEVPNKCP